MTSLKSFPRDLSENLFLKYVQDTLCTRIYVLGTNDHIKIYTRIHIYIGYFIYRARNRKSNSDNFPVVYLSKCLLLS